jgi:hypothetical protein
MYSQTLLETVLQSAPESQHLRKTMQCPSGPEFVVIGEEVW